jgi:hypothetical protein
MTRQNLVPDGYALIPFWDMANHEPGGEVTTFYEVAHHSLACHAKRAFGAEQQVFIHYGRRPSADFLLYSGFVPRDNPDDALRLPLALSAGDALYGQKARVLQALGIAAGSGSGLGGARTLHASGALEWETLVFVRVLAMDAAGLAMLAAMPPADAADALSSADGVSPACERAWTDYMSTRIKLLLARYRDVLAPAGSAQMPNAHAQQAQAMIDSERRILNTTERVLADIRARLEQEQ